MQIPPSIKEFLAVFFALLYLLSPLNEEILEISHLVSHEISETFSANQHTHAHSHSGISSHEHEPPKHKSHAKEHSHDVLEFISTALNISDEEQAPVENTKKETYDKHLIESYSQIQPIKATEKNTYSAYIHRKYSHFPDNLFPPPEPVFHKI